MKTNIKKAPKVSGRSFIFSAFYTDFLSLPQISDYHHLNVFCGQSSRKATYSFKPVSPLQGTEVNTIVCKCPNFLVTWKSNSDEFGSMAGPPVRCLSIWQKKHTL